VLTSPRNAPAPPRHRSRLNIRGAVVGTVGARIGSAMVSLVAGIIVVRHLGTTGRSHLAVLLAVPGVFGIMGLLGLDTANLRFASRSHTAFRQLVRWSLEFSLVGGTIMPALWWLAGRDWPVLWLGLDPRLAAVSAALCPLTAALALLGTAETGRGHPVSFGLVTAGTTVVYLAGVLLTGHWGEISVLNCGIIYGVGQAGGVITLLLLAIRHSQPAGDRVLAKEYRSYARQAYLPNAAQYGMLRMDVPLIELLAGTTAVALYAVALPLAEGLMLLPIAVTLVLFPKVTAGTVDRGASVRIAWAVVGGTLALAAVIGLAAPVFVPLAYGHAYRGSVAVVWWMLPGLVIFSAGRTAQTYLSATDRMRHVTMASAAGVGAGLVALIVLAPSYGAAGAGAADSVGYLAYTVYMLAGLRRSRSAAGPATSHRTSALPRAGLLGRAGRATGPVRVRVTGRRPSPRRLARVYPARSALGRLVRPGNVAVAAGAAVAALLIGLASTAATKPAVLIAGVVVIVLMVALPEAGLCVLAVVVPVSQTTGGADVITATDLLVLVLACLAGQAAAGRLARPRPALAALALALVGYFMLSAVLSAGPGTDAGHNALDVVALGFTLLGLTLVVRDGPAARRAMLVFAATAAVASIVEIPVAQSSLTQSGGNTSIAAGQTGALNHNAEGALFVLAFGVLLAFLPQARGKLAKAAAITGLAMVSAGIAFSFSRESYFGVLAAVALFSLRRSLRGLAGGTIAVICALPFLPSSVMDRLDTVWSSNGLDASSAARVDLWSSALRIFVSHPLFGVGYLNFSTVLPSYFTDTGTYPIGDIVFSQLDFAHNTFLSVLAETGIVGALLTGALVVSCWRRAWGAAAGGDWTGEAALLGITGVGVCSIFGEPLFVPAVMAGFLLVVLAAPGPVPAAQSMRKVSRDGNTRTPALSHRRAPAARHAGRGHAHRRGLVLRPGDRAGSARP